jgi:hypothetical protein
MTSTPSVTPSATPVADVLLALSFTLGGAGGQTVTAANMLAPQVQSAITTQLAALLGLPASVIRVVNITDIATGQVTRVAGARLLGGAPGSLGVSVSVTANLGKTPTQAGVLVMTAALAGANYTAALAVVVQALATSLSKPASSFVAARGPAPTLANAPFSLPAPSASLSSGGGESAGLAGAVGGGVGGGLVAIILIICMLITNAANA